MVHRGFSHGDGTGSTAAWAAALGRRLVGNRSRESRAVLRVLQRARIDRVAAGGFRVGSAEADLIRQVANWKSEKRLGIVFSSNAGFTLPNRAMRSPDAAWIRSERWELVPVFEQGRYCPASPYNEVQQTNAEIESGTIYVPAAAAQACGDLSAVLP